MHHPQLLHEKVDHLIFKLDPATLDMSQHDTTFQRNIVGRNNGAFGHAIARSELHSSAFSLDKYKKRKKYTCVVCSPHDRVVVLTDGLIQPVAWGSICTLN